MGCFGKIGVFCLSLLSFFAPVKVESTFVSIGDWGAAALGGQYTSNVQAVSSRLKKTIREKDVEFVLNTGDNFYYCGIQNVHDSQITEDFRNQFEKTNISWYNTLGNHDYGYNVSAQIDLDRLNIIKNWIMEDRYYKREIQYGDSKLFTYFLDTNPCITDYRNDDPKYWDPCGTEYPTCSPNNTDDDYEGDCKFHENILSQDCKTQYDWFENSLLATAQKKKKEDWIIVVAHHPIYEVTVAPFLNIIDKYVDVYLNGHTHLLNYYEVNGKVKYITTGAGGMVDVSESKSNSLNDSNTLQNVVWQEKTAGFVLHTMENEMILRNDFIDWKGNIIKSIKINKYNK